MGVKMDRRRYLKLTGSAAAIAAVGGVAYYLGQSTFFFVSIVSIVSIASLLGGGLTPHVSARER
jgi:hypothetical protein